MTKLLLPGYYLFLLFFAVFPFHTAGIQDLDKSYVGTFRLDHLLHFFVFVPLIPLHCLKSGCKKGIETTKYFFQGLAVAIFCEGIQYFLPYRSFNLTDMAANAGGVILSLVIAWVVIFKNLFAKIR
ncbi:MAG: VanZ family protein [Bacteroidota bacterium]